MVRRQLLKTWLNLDRLAGRKRRRLFIHIGMHKTGTKTLHAAFDVGSHHLRGHGLVFAETGISRHPLHGMRVSHHYLLALAAAASREMRDHLLHGQDPERARMMDEAVGPTLLDDLAREMDASAPADILISSEAFCLLDQASIGGLGARFPAYDIVPVYVIRNFAGWMQSYYNTYITFGGGTEAIRDLNGPFDLLSVVERWSAIATDRKVRVLELDALLHPTEPLWSRFLDLGLRRPWAGPPLYEGTDQNVSLAPMVLVLCRELRRSGASEEQIRAFLASVAHIAPAERQTLLGPDQAAQLDARYADELARLRASPLVDGVFALASAAPTSGGVLIEDLSSALAALIRARTVTGDATSTPATPSGPVPDATARTGLSVPSARGAHGTLRTVR